MVEIDDQARALMMVALSMQVEDGETESRVVLARALTVLQAAAVGVAKMGGLSEEQFHRSDSEMWIAVLVKPDEENVH